MQRAGSAHRAPLNRRSAHPVHVVATPIRYAQSPRTRPRACAQAAHTNPAGRGLGSRAKCKDQAAHIGRRSIAGLRIQCMKLPRLSCSCLSPRTRPRACAQAAHTNPAGRGLGSRAECKEQAAHIERRSIAGLHIQCMKLPRLSCSCLSPRTRPRACAQAAHTNPAGRGLGSRAKCKDQAAHIGRRSIAGLHIQCMKLPRLSCSCLSPRTRPRACAQAAHTNPAGRGLGSRAECKDQAAHIGRRSIAGLHIQCMKLPRLSCSCLSPRTRPRACAQAAHTNPAGRGLGSRAKCKDQAAHIGRRSIAGLRIQCMKLPRLSCSCLSPRTRPRACAQAAHTNPAGRGLGSRAKCKDQAAHIGRRSIAGLRIQCMKLPRLSCSCLSPRTRPRACAQAAHTNPAGRGLGMQGRVQRSGSAHRAPLNRRSAHPVHEVATPILQLPFTTHAPPGVCTGSPHKPSWSGAW